MYRLNPPACDCCKSTRKVYRMDSREVQLCYECIFRAASFMAKHDLLESNPLTALLFKGVWQSDDSRFLVWHRSLHENNAASQKWIDS